MCLSFCRKGLAVSYNNILYFQTQPDSGAKIFMASLQFGLCFKKANTDSRPFHHSNK